MTEDAMNTKLTCEQLKEILSYDPDTGIFIWRIVPRLGRVVGDQAGRTMSTGYIEIKYKGSYYKAHRLACLYMTGAMTPLSGGADHLRPPGGEHWDDLRYEAFGLTADHVCRMWARYVDQTHPPPTHIANLIIGVTADVRAAIESDRARRQGALLQEALDLSKYAAAPFFGNKQRQREDDEVTYVWRTTEEWWDGLRDLIEAIQPKLVAALSLKGAKD